MRGRGGYRGEGEYLPQKTAKFCISERTPRQ